MSDLVIYDTEATDVDKRHAQITEFGAITTDMDFRVKSEESFRVARLPWVVPAPKALEVTKQRAEDLDIGISEFKAARRMATYLTPGYGVERTLVTFNGMNFDDELIRTTLFRNLQNPWFFSGKMTSRLDVLNLVRFAKTLNQEALVVPTDDEGKLSWRLENLCKANGINLDAHEALADAYGTLEIAAHVRETTPEAWEIMRRVGNAARQEDLFAKAHRAGNPILLFQYFGEPRVIPCAVIGTNGQRGWVLKDLRAENAPETKDEIKEILFTSNTAFPTVKSNFAPITLDPATARAIDPTIDVKSIIEAASKIKGSSIEKEALQAYKERGIEPLSNMTSEEKIYSGFIADRDKPRMTSFNKDDNWDKRLAINFDDNRLQDFKSRILLAAHYSGETTFSDEVVSMLRDQCAEALARPYQDNSSRYMTIAKASQDGITKEWADWAEKAFDCDVDRENVQEPEATQMQMAF